MNDINEDVLDIVCVKHGDTIYDWTWVDRLYRSVTRSFTKPINFHVFTDKINPHRTLYKQHMLPELQGLEGWNKGNGAWWYKTFLFSNQHPLQKPIIYFDLDLVFVGNCDFLLDIPHDKLGLVGEHKSKWKLFKDVDDIRSFERTMGSREPAAGHFNSSIMVFDPSKYHYVWERYTNNRAAHQERYHSDQDFINDTVRFKSRSSLVEIDPLKVVYWDFHVRNGGVKSIKIDQVLSHPDKLPNRSVYLTKRVFYNDEGVHTIPDDARIVVFNGQKTKEVMMKLDLIKEYWV